MYPGRTTLSKFLIEQLGDKRSRSPLASLLVDVAAAIKAIAAMTAKGALDGHYGEAGSDNSQGELQKKLDLLSNEAMIEHCNWGGQLAGMASEEMAEPYVVPNAYKKGSLLLLFDPLDGSSNIDVNVSIGTIFSVLAHTRRAPVTEADFLQAGHRQLAAGYAIYGPSTMLVLTVGKGTHGFTLDREVGNFVLTHPDLQIPEDTSEFAINASNERFWEAPVTRFVEECKLGRNGPRERDFNMRWIASMVADVHRVLMRGGVYLYPGDARPATRSGRLRLLYEINPMSLLVEQAGGRASYGRGPALELQPESLHMRAPVILGSRHEVERVERYHAEHDAGTDKPYSSPLFNERSLYAAEA